MHLNQRQFIVAISLYFSKVFYDFKVIYLHLNRYLNISKMSFLVMPAKSRHWNPLYLFVDIIFICTHVLESPLMFTLTLAYMRQCDMCMLMFEETLFALPIFQTLIAALFERNNKLLQNCSNKFWTILKK